MKYAAFKLAGVALSLSLAWTSAQAAALRVAADPVPHAEILNYIKKIDPSLDLKVVELTSGVNANELPVSAPGCAVFRRKYETARSGRCVLR